MPFDRQAYNNKFTQEHYKKYSFRLDREKDIELIEYLNGVGNVNEYIKQLIIKDRESR